MAIERQTEEPIDRRQEMINHIYDTSLKLPATGIEVDPKIETDLGAVMFSYHFLKGTTTPGFSDQLSKKYNVNNGEMDIFYAKGIYAGRITLVKNPETSNVDLKNFVYQKDTQQNNSTSFSIVQSASKPHFHAIESLLADVEKKMENDPNLFRKNLTNEQQQQEDNEIIRLYGIILGRIAKKEVIQKREKRKIQRNIIRKK